MSPLSAAIVTGIGLLLALAGVACGAVAYVGTVREHDTLPVWPWADRRLKQLRRLLLFKRDVRHGTATSVLALSGFASGTATASGALTIVRSNETLDERVNRLEQRLERAEQRAAEEATRAQQAESQLGKQLVEQGRRLDEADEQLRDLAKAVAVDSARLQLAGLILVGIGTALMAVPTIAAIF